MTTIIDAVYEGGFFRPVEKVDLTEGTHVEVRIPRAVGPRDPNAVATKLEELAAKALRGPKQESAGSDHDEFLYGGKKQP